MMASKSFNLSGNLADLLKSSSNLDLGLVGLGLSSSDFGGLMSHSFGHEAKADAPSAADQLGAVVASLGPSHDTRIAPLGMTRGQSFGLSLVRGKSGLGVETCASELSLSGFLNESELVTGGGGSSGSAETTPPASDGLQEIMSDFGGHRRVPHGIVSA